MRRVSATWHIVSGTEESELRLKVSNDSWRAIAVSAVGSVIAQRYPWWDHAKQASSRGDFSLQWISSVASIQRIQAHDSADLAIARLAPYGDTKVPTVTILSLAPGICETSIATDRVDGSPPAEWDLLFTVYRHTLFGKRVALKRGFTLHGLGVDGKPGVRLSSLMRTEEV